MDFVKSILIGTFLCFSLAASEEGWFWHVTDFHYDFSYWLDQLSCNGVGPTNPGRYGDSWCDSPRKLVDDTIARMKTTKPDVDFVLWSGDSVPHVPESRLNRQLNIELVTYISHEIKSQFGNTTVYPTFGNHDYYHTNLFPPHANEMYNDTYQVWKTWIGDPAQEATFLKGGYYTALASSNIRIVALNTNMYYYKDTVTQGLSDPTDQFAWLENVLTAAASNNEKVSNPELY